MMNLWNRIRTFFIVLYNAHKTATLLDDCCRLLGSANKLPDGRWSVDSDERSRIVFESNWKCLPRGYNWRI
jgi:hypothetical protein